VSARRAPHKRAAFEPLAPAVTGAPDMHRPAATVAGAVLVFLRAAAGMLWAFGVAFELPPWLQAVAAASGDASDGSSPLTLADFDTTPGVFLGVLGFVALVQVVFGSFVLAGGNVARVVVMVISTLSIIGSFIGWWEFGQDITVRTTLLTLSLDILVLLALSSREAAAYARRPRRRRRERRRDGARTPSSRRAVGAPSDSAG